MNVSFVVRSKGEICTTLARDLGSCTIHSGPGHVGVSDGPRHALLGWELVWLQVLYLGWRYRKMWRREGNDFAMSEIPVGRMTSLGRCVV